MAHFMKWGDMTSRSIYKMVKARGRFKGELSDRPGDIYALDGKAYLVREDTGRSFMIGDWFEFLSLFALTFNPSE